MRRRNWNLERGVWLFKKFPNCYQNNWKWLMWHVKLIYFAKMIDSDSNNNEFINNVLESSRKYKDKQLDDIEKLDQIESILTYLG